MSLYIKKAFDLTKDNIILAQPLVIFMIVLSFTLAGLAQQSNRISYVVVFVANILLCTAFMAGWFYMVIKGIAHYKKVQTEEYKNPQEIAQASLDLGKEFFPGVGEYFLRISYTTVAYVVVYMLILVVCYKLGTQFLPNPNLDYDKFITTANSTPLEMQKYVYSLSFDQLKAINLWMLFVGGITTIFTFLTLFLYPAVYDKKDFILYAPFSAFNRNLIFLFKNFIGSVGILVFLFFLNFLLSIFSLLFSINIILAIVGLIISFYVMTYAVVLIFLYYEERK